MKTMWPLRIEYILGAKARAACSATALGPSPELTLFKGADTLVVMNKYPYINGHLLVRP